MSEPRNSFANLSDADLERALTDLGTSVTFPETPDLTAVVAARIADAPRPMRPSTQTPFPLRRVLAVAAIILVALAAALALSSGFRDVLADLFGVRGIRIVIEHETPTPTAGPSGSPIASPVAFPTAASPTATLAGTGLLLGRSVTLAEAQARVPYPIHVPTLPGLGAPDEIYLRTLPDGNQMVSFLYSPSPSLPETAGTGVGALLMQFEGRNDVSYFVKGVMDAETPEFLQVNGNQGIWIQGTHSLTMISDPSIGCCGGSTRTAGNVLLWEQDGLTFRLETSLSLDGALQIAESVRPPVEPATPTAS